MEYQALSNGFQIIYENPVCSIPITSICVLCKTGSIHEPYHLKGVNHLIEHMSFKGTKRTPNTQEFLEQFNMLGIEQNAYTYHECVWFELKCPDQHVEKCIKLLSESILSCDFSLENFEKEEKVVYEENQRNDDNPEFVISTATRELVFEDTQFQYPVDDSKYHKKKFHYKEVYDYYKKTYIPSNLFLSITTNTAFKKIVEYIKKSEFAKASPPSLNVMKFIPQRDGFDYEFIEKKLKTVLLNVSFKTCDYYSVDSYILSLLKTILGDGLNGRLVNVLRQNNGLVYYANTVTDYNFCGGQFTIVTQCDPSSLVKKNGVLPLIMEELKKLKSGITEKELTISKIKKKGELLFAMENSNTLSSYNAWSLLYYQPSDIVPYSKIYETFIENITISDVNECIKKYFCFERMCLTVMGLKISQLELLDECTL